MKKYSKLIIAAIVALVFIGTFVVLWKKSQPKEIVYTEFKPEMRDIQKTTVITGTIEPRNEVNIKPQISGIISELLKEPGQMVQAGEVIAKVKVIPDMGQLSNAESRVRLSEINLKQVETDYSRMENLHKQSLISDEEFEKSRQQLKQAREEKAAADDALQVVRDGVSKSNASASSTLIRSTISGVILDIPVKVGNSVINSNTFNDGTTIATVANMEDLIFRGNIDETEVGQLSIGMPMKLTIGAMQDLTVDATLEYISPKAVQNNGANQFEIKAAVTLASLVDKKSGQSTTVAYSNEKVTKIRSGYSANAEIVLNKVDKVLSLPESSIEFVGDSTFVFVLVDSTKERRYERKPVETGLSDGVNIEIKNGVKSGETVRGPQIFGEEK
jgi:HlyD family secretion protein